MKKRKKFIPVSEVCFAGNERRYVSDAVDSTWVSSKGKYIDEFEKKFSSYTGAKHAVCISNGSCALILALKALGIGQGDEVIVPSLTFAASVNSVLHLGATPVMVDCEPDFWNIDAKQIEKAITKKTRAVMPVHLYGQPCNMKAILRIAKKFGIFVVEDAAEAQGAKCMEKNVGTLGEIGCFSFYGNKIVTTGEGGMCVTNDAELGRLMRQLRDHGMNPDRRYWHEKIGYNFRMTNVNAALGVAQMEGVAKFIARRAELARLYEKGIASIDGLKVYPKSPYGSKVDWLQCAFVTKDFPISRDELINKLKKYKIDSRPTFYPVHMMPPYKNCRVVGDMKNSKKFGLSGINLPLYPEMKDEDVHYIIEALRELNFSHLPFAKTKKSGK